MSLDATESTELTSLSDDELTSANGGMSSAARFIMMHESGGNARAGHLYKQGRGDGTRGNHSSAYGAFQMIQATRKQYMGKNYQSSDFNLQYQAASHYVRDRYGSWEGAQRFWQKHHWY